MDGERYLRNQRLHQALVRNRGEPRELFLSVRTTGGLWRQTAPLCGRFARLLVVVSAAVICGCSTVLSDRGEFCSEMARFANATPAGETRSVQLVTNWSELSKFCSDGGSEAGKTFCGWLLQNTSTEFQHYNIRRALMCLGDSGIWLGRGAAFPEYVSGKIRSYSAKGADENVRIEVEYADGIEGQFPSLKISAERWVLDE